MFFPAKGVVTYVQVPDPYDDDSDHFLIWLPVMRRMYDFTRKQLCSATGLNYQYVYKLEKLQHKARPETSTMIAKAMGFHFFPEWLWMPLSDNPCAIRIVEFRDQVSNDYEYVGADPTIRETRHKQKISVKELAKYAEVKESSIWRVEAGQKIRESALMKIQRTLEDHIWQETDSERADRFTREWQRDHPNKEA